MKPSAVRARFAPSPTGYLHVGGVRTALFNWLFARHNGGVFVLRVEDTDVARSKPEYAAAILSGLRWLGLDWDEGPQRGGPHAPYFQSQRLHIYREAARALEAAGCAYECFCPSDAFAGETACDCASLSPRDKGNRLRSGAAPALKFRVDTRRDVAVEDVIRGTVVFPAGSIHDFVLCKSGGDPLYNFAAVVDDNAMAISHVIRGDEHLANTPRQLLVYEALGLPPPIFAHIPIILSEQRRKLSKRDGATFLDEYEKLGYLPEALLNFLGLLGWSPGGDRELLTVAEMIAEFRLADVVKHPAIFDVRKLGWMNKEYLKAAPLAEIAARVEKLLPEDVRRRYGAGRIAAVTGLLRPRVQNLAEIVSQGWYFFTDKPVTPIPEAIAKYCAGPEPLQRLRELREQLARLKTFSEESVETEIRSLAERAGTKAAAYIHPLRVALTGQAVSPGIFEVCAILGREQVLERIDALIGALSGALRATVRMVP